MVKAMNVKVGNPLSKLVLIKLADNASDKGECWPSYQHIADQCEISKRSVMRHISSLCDAGLIRKEYRLSEKGNCTNLYLLTLDEDQKQGGIGSVRESLGGVRESLPPSDRESPRTSHSFEPVIEPRSFTSENESSDTHGELAPLPDDGKAIQSGSKWGTADDLAAAEWMFGQVLAIAPKAKKPNYAAWANEIRLMRERDGKQHREMCELFRWACQDSFWSGNILCPVSLRRKWDQLEIKRNKQLAGTANSASLNFDNTDWAKGLLV
ncbi:Uncharacterised protein [Plesiomonas shigelloides]|nr:Uncharacterised protein [Plesiomonas shigelloides]